MHGAQDTWRPTGGGVWVWLGGRRRSQGASLEGDGDSAGASVVCVGVALSCASVRCAAPITLAEAATGSETTTSRGRLAIYRRHWYTHVTTHLLDDCRCPHPAVRTQLVMLLRVSSSQMLM